MLIVWLASRSVAWPLGLAGAPAVLAALLGHDPLPNKVPTVGVAVWILLAVAFVASRVSAPPARLLFTAAPLGSICLAVLLIVRENGAVAAYASLKVQLFIAVNLVMLLGGIFVGRGRRAFVIVSTLWIVLAAITAVALAHGLAGGQANALVGGRISIDAQNGPIGLGRNAARGIVVAVAFILTSRSSGRRVLAFAALPVIAVAFIASGSRGPVLGLVVGLAVLLALTLRERRARVRVLLVVAAGVVGAVLVTQLVPGEDVQRALSVLTGNGGGHSSNGRSELWAAAWEAFRAHPLLGVGTGGFAAVQQAELYPHNIFLEVGSELGIVGLVLLVVVLAAGTRSVWRSYVRASVEDRPQAALVAGLFAAALVNAQFSGDITTNSDLWLLVGLALGLEQQVTPAPSVADLALRIRGFRRDGATRAARRSAGVTAGPRRSAWLQGPTVGAPRSRGEIVVPRDGALVGGIVDVGGRPAETGWGVASVQLELSADGGTTWSTVPHAATEAFDVLRVIGGFREHVAVVRTQRVAELLATELERLDDVADRYLAELSPRRPWQLGAGWSLEWDARRLEAAEYLLRAVTLDVAGSRVATEPRRVRVDNAAAEAARASAPAPGAAELERRIADVEARATALAGRERVVVERERELAVLDRRRAELEALATDVAAREHELARLDALREDVLRREAAVARAEQVVADADLRAQAAHRREELLDARERETAAAAADAERLQRELEARAAAVAAAEGERERLALLRAELADRERSLAERESASETAARDAESRLEQLVRDRAALEARLVEAGRRERALAEQEAEAAAAAGERERLQRELELRVAEVAAAEQESTRLEAVRLELEEQERRIAGRETAVDVVGREVRSRTEELMRRRAELEAQTAELSRRESALAAREQEVAAAAAERERLQGELEIRAAEVAAAAHELSGLEALRDEVRGREAAASASVESARQLAAAAQKRLGEIEERRAALDERLAELALREDELAARERQASDETERRTAELSERAAALETREAELEEREHGLGNVSTVVADRERALADAEAALAAERAAAAAAAEDLRARQETLDQRVRALTERELGLGHTAAEVARREREVEGAAALHAEAERLAAANDAQARSLEERARDLERREEETERRRRELEAGAAAAAAERAEAARMRAEAATVGASAEERAAALRAEQERVQAAAASVEQRSAELEAAVRSAEERAAAAAAELERATERSRELDERVQMLTRREREFIRRTAELAAHEREAAELQRRADASRAQVDAEMAALQTTAEALAARAHALDLREAALGGPARPRAAAPEAPPAMQPPGEPEQPREPVPATRPEPTPEPELEQRIAEPANVVPFAAPPVPVTPARTAGGMRLAAVERIVAAARTDDPFVQAERDATLVALRSYVGVDDVVPAEFEPMLRELLGDLLPG